MHTVRINLRDFFTLAVRKMSKLAETFKGVPMEEIYHGRDPFDLDHLPPVANERNHIVLYKLPITDNSTRPPEPYKGEIKWDSNHVRMPHAPQNEYITESASDPSKKITITRWELIEQALLRDIHSTYELQDAILSYNTRYAKQWKFKSLHAMFEDVDEIHQRAFFRKTLPSIIGLALQLPELVPCSIPLLRSGQNKSISLSQLQIACLLANAFLCTFPRRNECRSTSEYASYPSINFSTLFQTTGDQNIEKIKCIINYFRLVSRKLPTGVVTFTRRSVPETNFPNWSQCKMTFDNTLLHVSDNGTIEDDGQGLLQVDFANKYLGGGVLNYGCVQEEIRFVICPELLVSRLFTECLEDNECMIIMGCERFNAYEGYASSFEWTGSFVDETPCDSSRRRKCTIVAIDAVPFSKRAQQYKEVMLKRELNKAYVGFKHDLKTPAPGVATGNWGCGAFGGDKLLKSLLQLMACCVTKRPLVYYTFGDSHLRDDLFAIHQYLSSNKVTVAELWQCLKGYASAGSKQHMYEFIMSYHIELRERKSHTNVQSSTQTNRTEFNASKKPKRIEAAEKSPESQSSTTADINDIYDYNIEDSDGNGEDEQFSVDEVVAQLEKSSSEYNIQPLFKPPVRCGAKKSSLSPSTSASSSTSKASLTIRSFFSPTPKPTDSPNSQACQAESQEKRSRQSLVASLENDFNRKCPKIEQKITEPSNQSCDTESGIDPPESQKDLDESTKTMPQEQSHTVLENGEDAAMEQDGEDIESEESSLAVDDEKTAMSSPNVTDKSQNLFDESMNDSKDQATMDSAEAQETAMDIPEDEPNETLSSTPSKVNVRPRGLLYSYKQKQQNSPIGASTPVSATPSSSSSTSSQDILTQNGSELNGSNDQENFDLNTEADQLKALNVTAEKD